MWAGRRRSRGEGAGEREVARGGLGCRLRCGGVRPGAGPGRRGGQRLRRPHLVLPRQAQLASSGRPPASRRSPRRRTCCSPTTTAGSGTARVRRGHRVRGGLGDRAERAGPRPLPLDLGRHAHPVLRHRSDQPRSRRGGWSWPTRGPTSTVGSRSRCTGSRRPPVTAGQDYVEQDVPAEVIPLAYYANATTSTRTKLNVEAMAIDPAGNAWFVPRNSTLPYSYMATAHRVEPGRRAARRRPGPCGRPASPSNGPMTDASFSPDGTMLLVKSISTVYAYDLRTNDRRHRVGRARRAPWPRPARPRHPGTARPSSPATTAASSTVAEGSKTQTQRPLLRPLVLRRLTV